MENIKEQLCLNYPFLKKEGTIIHTSFDVQKALARDRNEKLLIMMAGVQGSGKTTYCKEYFEEYPVVNVDDILREFLNKGGDIFSEELDGIFFDMVEENLRKRGIVIVDAGAVNLTFRVKMLEKLQGKFSKSILIVLNPEREQIINQIKGQINLRARPGLWIDVLGEYKLLQDQIEMHILEMGVDEVYMM